MSSETTLAPEGTEVTSGTNGIPGDCPLPSSPTMLTGLGLVLIPDPVLSLPPIMPVGPCLAMTEPAEANAHSDKQFYSTWFRHNILRVSKLLGSLLKVAKSK